MKKNKKKNLKKIIGIVGLTTIGVTTLNGCDFDPFTNFQMVMYGSSPANIDLNNEEETKNFIPEDNVTRLMYGPAQDFELNNKN